MWLFLLSYTYDGSNSIVSDMFKKCWKYIYIYEVILNVFSIEIELNLNRNDTKNRIQQ